MTESKPNIDVVILSWNREQDTLEAIRSALSQVDVFVHVWVVDQGSELACLTELRECQKRGEIYLEELGRNVGVAEGRNIAMAPGSSPYIVSLDNDAVFEDVNTLRRIADKFD